MRQDLFLHGKCWKMLQEEVAEANMMAYEVFRQTHEWTGNRGLWTRRRDVISWTGII